MKDPLGRGYRSCRKHAPGFTLIELLVAVVILAIGVVGVLRSFLSTVSVLDNLNNRMAAIELLEIKANEATALTWFGEKDVLQEKEEDLRLLGRKAFFRSEIMPFNDPLLKEDLGRVSMSVVWQEGNVLKDETIIFMLPVNK